MLIFINIVVFLILLIVIQRVSRRFEKLSPLVAIGLAGGVLFGLTIQLIYEPKSEITTETLRWINIVGEGYTSLLKMIVMPLILVSVLSAMSKISSFQVLGKIGGSIFAVLLFTVFLSAFIGWFLVKIIHFNIAGLITSASNINLPENLASNMTKIENFHVADYVLSLIPHNPFLFLTGIPKTAVTGVVIFSILLSLAALLVKKEDPQNGSYLDLGISVIQIWIMKLVKIVIQLTPYGICALITRVAANSQIAEIAKLIDFVILSYVGILLMFLIHGLLLFISGINPVRFFLNIMPVLIFSFSSRSSAATIPLNIETQIKTLNISPSIATLSASLGSTIGQNGCAGLYPAMLASMTALALGIDIGNWHWVLMLLFIIVLSSIGIAGIGGGATFAALIVLPNMGLPLTLVVVLIAIEPIIDMGRTSLNVSGSMVAGALTNKFLKKV